MKTIEEMIAVMQAFADGKEIESAENCSTHKIWEWIYNPIWNWYKYDYRVKPTPEYIPFTFEDAEFLIGKSIKHNKGSIFSIIGVQESGIVTIHPTFKIIDYSWKELLEEFRFFPNSSPCGKLKQ